MQLYAYQKVAPRVVAQSLEAGWQAKVGSHAYILLLQRS